MNKNESWQLKDEPHNGAIAHFCADYEKKFGSDEPEEEYLQTATLGDLALACKIPSHDPFLDRALYQGEVVLVFYSGKSNVDLWRV
jgi:hypothetical protein